MDLETYEQMPEFLDVRERRVHVHQPGFRPETLVVVTTLTDHRTYSSQDIAALYHKRRLVELDIRAIKRRPKPHRLLTKPRHEARRDKGLVGGRRSH
jgi:hypothetical protein